MKSNCSTISNKKPQTRNNERVTLVVVILTLVTMVVEIVSGLISGSMALLSDGIHMGTHALALFITLAAYVFARKNRGNPTFSFGTGKVGVLGGYTNAILLLVAAAAMAVESIERLIFPVDILFNQAIVVAVVGLVVNIVSAVILGHGNDHHSHDHGHGHHHHHEDHNLKAAYLHVITDALTSVLAIAALLAAKFFGFNWADPVVGILGALVVGKWALGLLKQNSGVLLDRGDFGDEIAAIKSHIESDATKVVDVHLWQISENEKSLILGVETATPRSPGYFQDKLKALGHYDHITIEVNKEKEGKQ
ncbi:MAG: CDF family Co(II)/Ni(II) efflux transporter DmeF [Desulfobacteraceae bacterium]